MPETDPIDVVLTADPSDLVAGLSEGSRAMNRFGDSAEEMGVRVEGASHASKTLFRGLIELRVALTSTENVLKLFGVQNETVTKIMNDLNIIMDVAITVMAIYRAASFLVANADLARAAAAFLAGIAEVSAATLFIGTAAAIGLALASYESMKYISEGHFAQGGIVMPRAGGRTVTVAEGGEPEAIIPLSKAQQAGFGGIGGSPITMNVYSNDPDYISRQLARLIEQRRIAGY